MYNYYLLWRQQLKSQEIILEKTPELAQNNYMYF